MSDYEASVFLFVKSAEARQEILRVPKNRSAMEKIRAEQLRIKLEALQVPISSLQPSPETSMEAS